MKKILLVVLIIFSLFLISSFFFTKTVKPSEDTRVILEHTYKTYIAPVCFETADATNFLEESTLENAQEIGYAAHSDCTEEALEAEEHSFFVSILQEIGILNKKWDNW